LPMPDISNSANLTAPTPGAKSPYEIWRSQRVAWQTAYTRALTMQRAAKRRIRSLSLGGGLSGITGCVSALAQDLRAYGKPNLLLASDLQENVTAELSGSLENQPVFVIQPCPSGVAQTCDAAFARMRRLLHMLHAGTVERATAASIAPAVSSWLRS
jgi:hypothetical protein